MLHNTEIMYLIVSRMVMVNFMGMNMPKKIVQLKSIT